jgi:hypothetical protein
LKAKARVRDSALTTHFATTSRNWKFASLTHRCDPSIVSSPRQQTHPDLDGEAAIAGMRRRRQPNARIALKISKERLRSFQAPAVKP